ncbi:MAG: hypothetical protein ACXAEF_12485 [Candidatus Thorarchaeota archaeon]|jgi:hypothetical protein
MRKMHTIVLLAILIMSPFLAFGMNTTINEPDSSIILEETQDTTIDEEGDYNLFPVTFAFLFQLRATIHITIRV